MQEEDGRVPTSLLLLKGYGEKKGLWKFKSKCSHHCGLRTEVSSGEGCSMGRKRLLLGWRLWPFDLLHFLILPLLSETSLISHTSLPVCSGEQTSPQSGPELHLWCDSCPRGWPLLEQVFQLGFSFEMMFTG